MSKNTAEDDQITALRNSGNGSLQETNTEITLSERQHIYLNAATSQNTRRTYQSAIRHFERWGGRLPTDRDTLIRYLVEHAQVLNPRTLDIRLTAISQWHLYQGLVDPTKDPNVRKTLEGIRRVHGKPKQKAKALRLEHVATMIDWLCKQPETKKIARDLAILQVGFFGAFRRSELVAIEFHHLHWEPEGVIVELPHSKTDQEGKGIHRALPYGGIKVCPVKALKRWLAIADIDSGAVFRQVTRWDVVQSKHLDPSAINALLKKLGRDCNFDFANDLSSHSFRRGLSTSAARENVNFEAIKKQGGWKQDSTVREYIDEGRHFADNATLGLMTKVEALLK